PRTGRRPHAVVQLRQDTLAGDHLNLVGFQSRMKWGEQERVFRTIPGLEHAAFVRLGQVHRNTYVDAPRVIEATYRTRKDRSLFLAGQVAGVEGYIESTSSGLVAGLNAARLARGFEPVERPRSPGPATHSKEEDSRVTRPTLVVLLPALTVALCAWLRPARAEAGFARSYVDTSAVPGDSSPVALAHAPDGGFLTVSNRYSQGT